MIWKPNVTVAAVVEEDGKFLLVEERIDGRTVLNQPAGHLEPNESLLDAVVREVQEETGRQFEPQSLIGIYRWQKPNGGTTYLRFCFAGSCGPRQDGRALDDGIIDTVWLDRPEIERRRSALRSPMVLRCVDDYLAGRRFGLDLCIDVSDEW